MKIARPVVNAVRSEIDVAGIKKVILNVHKSFKSKDKTRLL